ncbi:hypothetical protein SBA4_1210026 [Candidatus Sulfopaludibacter sp. SbA4]|nr:hypothetical protein SBA4_1210026 [Candidatus Sulfopaludibacter sp. SbA4]
MDAVVKAFGEDVDYAKLIEYYGNEPGGERRYSRTRIAQDSYRR